MDAAYYVAGIDVHKKMLAVVVANARDRELQFECRRFGTTVSELQNLSTWSRTSSEGQRERSNAQTPKATAPNPVEEAGILSSANPAHGFTDGPIDLFEGVAGEAG